MSRSFDRLLGAVAGSVVIALLLVAPAAAAPPANDTYGGAAAISALPYSATLDTTQATADAADTSANADCGAPAPEASVWYSFTPTAATGVSVDVSGSSYSAGVIVVTGSPGNFQLVNCNEGSLVFSAKAGVTYYLLVFDDTPGPPNGGTLQISVSEVQLPEVTVTVNPTGGVTPKAGVITASGTFTCMNTNSAFIFVTVTQSAGRFTISGSTNLDADPCDGQPHPWSANVTGDNGRFAGGKASVDAFMLACITNTCSTDEVIQTIHLRAKQND